MKMALVAVCVIMLLLTNACEKTPASPAATNTEPTTKIDNMEKGTSSDTIISEQDNSLDQTECEGCEKEEGDLPDRTNGDLQLTVQLTGDGFRIAHTEEQGYYMAQTLVSPPIEGVSYGVHIIRMNRSAQEFRRDAVVVNPVTAEFQIYPLYDVLVDDSYGADSIAEAYGFLDDRYLVYVSIVNDTSREAGYYYRIEKLDILTGETTILFPEIPDAPRADHFAPGWLNAAKDTLVLNSYATGQLWSFNLLTGEIIRPKANFSHYWPYILTIVSLDGERFWYSDYAKREYRLHDKSGKLLSNVAFSKGFDQYPAFLWSPDSQYSAYQDTREQNEAHIIEDNGEVYIIAPNRIRFFDRHGKLNRTIQRDEGSGTYIEIAGWLDDPEGVVVLHEYELDRITQSHLNKINSRYLLLDIKSGENHALQTTSDFSEIINGVPARISRFRISKGIYWVDTKRKLLMIFSEDGKWLSKPGEKQAAWVTNGDGQGATVFHEFDQTTGQNRERVLGHEINDIHIIGKEWLVCGDMHYTRLEERSVDMKFIDRQEAIKIAKKYDNNEDLIWEALFEEDMELILNNRRETFNVWTVTATYPFGNKIILHIDANSGEVITITEVEAHNHYSCFDSK